MFCSAWPLQVGLSGRNLATVGEISVTETCKTVAFPCVVYYTETGLASAPEFNLSFIGKTRKLKRNN